MKHIHLYSLNRHYHKLVIYTGDSVTGGVIATAVIKPKEGLTRYQRYEELVKIMAERTGNPIPCYKE